MVLARNKIAAYFLSGFRIAFSKNLKLKSTNICWVLSTHKKKKKALLGKICIMGDAIINHHHKTREPANDVLSACYILGIVQQLPTHSILVATLRGRHYYFMRELRHREVRDTKSHSQEGRSQGCKQTGLPPRSILLTCSCCLRAGETPQGPHDVPRPWSFSGHVPKLLLGH